MVPVSVPDPTPDRTPADALLVVPPFALYDRPSMAAHILQACARAAGFEVGVVYANLSLASEIGPQLYSAICRVHSHLAFLGERFFCQEAFGGEFLGSQHHLSDPGPEAQRKSRDVEISWTDYTAAAELAHDWLDTTAQSIIRSGSPVVGVTSCFQQNSAAVALQARIKSLDPEVITILGGANCAGEMAEGVLSIAPSIDYVFSGDGEETFPRFLEASRTGNLPLDRIIFGNSCSDLDAIPTPEYTEYFDQLDGSLPDFPKDDIWLPYETSRGCWWGQHRRCTFCGLNSLDAGFRTKSPSRVAGELLELEERYPSRRVAVVDNVMPMSALDTLIPELAERRSDLTFFFELRAGMTLEQMTSLSGAGVTAVQFGIEALAPSLLNRLNKGTTPAQNIAVLRYGRSLKIAVLWNLLYEIPGDTVDEYELTAELLPLLSHLSPPHALVAVSIDRFSRYFEQPADFGIDNLRCFQEYTDVFPDHADLQKLAYYFDGDYASGSRDHPEIIEVLDREIEATRARWIPPEGPPVLAVIRLGGSTFLLRDTRGVSLDAEENRLVTHDQALAALAEGPAVPNSAIEWALANKAAVRIGTRVIPLATADAGLLAHFEAKANDPELAIADVSA